MRHLLLFATCYLIASCSSVTSDEKKLIDVIVKSESGLFRGLDLGINPSEVKTSESIGLTEEAPDYLFYEFAIDTATNYTVSYTFEENVLNEIQADIYVANDSVAKNLSDSFIKYLSKKYQDPVTENNGIWMWTTLYNKMPIRIELRDESADYDHVGKVALVVYKEPEMAM